MSDRSAVTTAPQLQSQPQIVQQPQSQQSQPTQTASSTHSQSQQASSSSHHDSKDKREEQRRMLATMTPEERKKALQGTHSFWVNTCKFTIDRRYSPLKPLGRGAYGVVCSAIDLVNDKKLAIKKIPKAFEDLVDAKRIVREVKMLRHFRHENIIGLYDLVDPPLNQPFDDIYVIMDFMETDLHQIIYSKNELTDEHIQYFVYQMLRGLKYIHSAHVLHRDLKPSNLLLNGNCDLRICDFGLARGVKEEIDYELTEYVVTRWYRAPEVMCSSQDYDQKIDVWSVGCILAEIHGRKPLFPGDDYIKQMNLIFEKLGTPTEADMKFISNEKALDYIKLLKKQPKIPFAKIYPHANPLAIDLMEKMLTFNPHRRISVEEALKHPYLKGLHNPKTEPVCKVPFDFEFEKCEMTREVLRELIWDEILVFRPNLKEKRDKWMQLEKHRLQMEQREKLRHSATATNTPSTSTVSTPSVSISLTAASSNVKPTATTQAPHHSQTTQSSSSTSLSVAPVATASLSTSSSSSSSSSSISVSVSSTTSSTLSSVSVATVSSSSSSSSSIPTTTTTTTQVIVMKPSAQLGTTATTQPQHVRTSSSSSAPSTTRSNV
eukprot:TRINITY_DN162_c0_g1_i1.p1 TRINITY_DN162_c0_g1~~TRINITY_DN162_c0_g1_i1.p1  ORF type:complete len:604 (-),score=216.54 TRINITY_DN162_c0_g1_i1:371-2182(-)